jgi:hypothetical protein
LFANEAANIQVNQANQCHAVQVLELNFKISKYYFAFKVQEKEPFQNQILTSDSQGFDEYQRA